MSDWDDWIGRTTERADRLDRALARRWLATFDLPEPTDEIMPPGIYFCLCTPDANTANLGEDGHPLRDAKVDSLLPPIPLPRRMWAASEMIFSAPLMIGQQVDRTSRIASITQKDGASGTLAFVAIEHVTLAAGAEAVRETQTLVYREAAAADAPLTPTASEERDFRKNDWNHIDTLMPDPRLLLRYSALTFNTHRIHYDLPYARDIERYRGLVVHGPLIASLLIQMFARHNDGKRLARFSFRAVSPAIVGEPLHSAIRRTGHDWELGAFADDGRQVMRAEAEAA